MGGVKLSVLGVKNDPFRGGVKNPEKGQKTGFYPLSKAFFHYPRAKKSMASAALVTCPVTKTGFFGFLAIFGYFGHF